MSKNKDAYKIIKQQVLENKTKYKIPFVSLFTQGILKGSSLITDENEKIQLAYIARTRVVFDKAIIPNRINPFFILLNRFSKTVILFTNKRVVFVNKDFLRTPGTSNVFWKHITSTHQEPGRIILKRVGFKFYDINSFSWEISGLNKKYVFNMFNDFLDLLNENDTTSTKK